MERNQNGYPTERQDHADSGDCGGMDICMNDLLLAYAYVPIQRWRMLYPTEKALERGTMFEELDKPMEVYGYEW